MHSFFSKTLLRWHQQDNDRSLPWKSETDPYKIWLSEIILQQTRAEQGMPYYKQFITAYPNVHQLAMAPEDEVFRLWQGLGYYNRCRNMIATAKEIAARGGAFPDTYEGLLALKGVGPYTAAAIASFAFGRPNAVIDGNVYRLLSRYFAISLPIDSTEGKKTFGALAQQLLVREAPAAYNQAIMDFGAVVCVPRNPNCDSCPLAQKCKALQEGSIALLPVKHKKVKVTERHFHYLILQYKDKVFIRQRNANDIWQGLYEFIIDERPGPEPGADMWPGVPVQDKVIPVLQYKGKQRLTHQLIYSYFYVQQVKRKPEVSLNGQWITEILIKNYAFPKTIVSFLHRKGYF